MNINELPEEILVRILSFLPRSDRLESALTCRRWAQTIARAPPLLRDIRLVVGRNEMKEAETVFAKNHRQYENLRLKGLFPNYEAAFWTRVGPTLRELKIYSHQCSSEVFFSILQACSNLESLKIGTMSDNMFKLFDLPPAIKLESIQESMFNLRHLHLGLLTNADTLESLLILMPNVSSIAFESLYLKSDVVSRLPNMLGTSRRIMMVNSTMGLSNDNFEQLLRISSASLRSLRYDGDISVPSVLKAFKDCSMLRDLDINRSRSPIDDSFLLHNILQNVPDLESLSIRHAHNDHKAYRQEDLMAIFNLKRLRRLHLNYNLVIDSNACVPDEIVQHLSRMISLESLTVGYGLGTVDNTRFRILAGMPNLRELVIDRLRWDAECFRIVLSDLGKLNTLVIRGPHDERRFLSCDQHSELERKFSTPQDSVSSDRQGEQRFSSLEVLRILYIPLCDACLGRITAHHSRLKIVTLLPCHDITDAGLVNLFQHLPLLEKLSVGSGKKLYGTFLEGVGELCRRLRFLEIPPQDERINSQAKEGFKLRRPTVKCNFC